MIDLWSSCVEAYTLLKPFEPGFFNSIAPHTESLSHAGAIGYVPVLLRAPSRVALHILCLGPTASLALSILKRCLQG